MNAGDERQLVFTGPKGTFLWEGAGPTDEIFTHGYLGVLNITKAWGLIRLSPNPTPERFPIDAGLKRYLSEASAPEEHVIEEMPETRLNDPVLFILNDFRFYLIDDVHRMHKRIRLGLQHGYGFVLHPAALDEIRVNIWKLEPDGTRAKFDMENFVRENYPTAGEVP